MANSPANVGGEGEDNSGSGRSDREITIHGDVHLSPNDIDALRRLADEHPYLAKQVVRDRHRAAVLDNNTERLGMVVTSVVAIVLVVGASTTLIHLGWWQSTMFVAMLLGTSHVIRTILRGEFSDTSWFGKIMTRTPRQSNGDLDEDG